MENNQSELEPGEWVILKDDEIIAHNHNAKIILEKAKDFEYGEIIVTKVPTANYCFY